MALTGMDDGEVQKLASPSDRANFGRSRDVVAWGEQRDERVSSSSDYNNNNGLYAFSSLLQSFSRGSGNGTKVSVISNQIL